MTDTTPVAVHTQVFTSQDMDGYIETSQESVVFVGKEVLDYLQTIEAFNLEFPEVYDSVDAVKRDLVRYNWSLTLGVVREDRFFKIDPEIQMATQTDFLDMDYTNSNFYMDVHSYSQNDMSINILVTTDEPIYDRLEELKTQLLNRLPFLLSQLKGAGITQSKKVREAVETLTESIFQEVKHECERKNAV